MVLSLALALVCAGALLWPSPWADPRDAFWRERVRARTSAGPRDSPAADVAVAALLLVIALRTGLPVVAALERVAAHCRPDISGDLMRVVTAHERAGDRPADAWSGAPGTWQPIAAAMIVASRAGVAPGPLLRAAARAILRRESVAQETMIGRVSVRLVLPLGLVLLPAFMGTTVLPLVLVMTRDYLGP
ncbi:MAG: type II secretion system F family protein [Dermatophilaceae bacterium]